ncbi:cysteine synthase A [Formicincola oecophyllae]|uniref:cysteine synthase n=1 Tax=Formicincola oecophyllae TaxID=2558361 RepID=A0A4Y6UBE4_9PROT|nr:cysteine synthase A [Formicincola oecophyllae]QDH13435.1 cysteine synthase A [Formicincola oecophyllae]
MTPSSPSTNTASPQPASATFAKPRGRVYDSILETVGGTPLVAVPHLSKKEGLKARLLLKLEFFNPLASVKDRIGVAMLKDAEAKGLITPGKTTIVEPTSGNTGIGLTFAGVAMGYPVIVVMPESASIERRKMMALMGAKLVLTPAAKGMAGAIAKADEIVSQTPGAWSAGQFVNQANPAIHEATTAQEIWVDTHGTVDGVIGGIGTGGTLTGIGRGLKKHNPNIKIIGIEPRESAVLHGDAPGPHGIQGLGAGFKPDTLDLDYVDEVMTVSEQEALATARMSARTEGIPIGISGGAALYAAMEVARKPEWAGKTLVAIIPSFAERYLSTKLFDEAA